MTRPSPTSRRAFTLIELVVAMSVTVLLLGAMSSAVMLASKAMPTGNSPQEAAINLDQQIQAMCEDIGQALYITESTATAIRIVVPDRNADGKPEVIRYVWSGGPLTRQVNLGSTDTIVSNVSSLNLTYATRSQSVRINPLYTESAETLLASNESTTSQSDFLVTFTNWVGQHIAPTLPVGSGGWKVTSIQFKGMQDTSGGGDNKGEASVHLRPALASKLPDTTSYSNVKLKEKDLPASSYSWMVATVTTPYLSPTSALCLTIEPDITKGAGAVMKSPYSTAAPGKLNRDASTNWFYTASNALLYRVYGTYLQAAAAETITQTVTSSITLSIQTSNPAARADRTIRMFNQPPVVTYAWDADFSASPTTLDFNGDGVADWVMSSGSFNTSELAAGAWKPGSTALRTNSSFDFNVPITIDLRWRDNKKESGGAQFTTYCDQSALSYAYIEATLTNDDDESQELTLRNASGLLGTMSTLITIKDIPLGFVDTRLIINPATNRLAVHINGAPVIAVTYATATNILSAKQYASIASTGQEPAIDRIRVVVGGASP